MSGQTDAGHLRTLIYVAIVVLLVAIYLGALRNVDPIYLAVGFIGEIILVCTVHLSSVIQNLRSDSPNMRGA